MSSQRPDQGQQETHSATGKQLQKILDMDNDKDTKEKRDLVKKLVDEMYKEHKQLTQNNQNLRQRSERINSHLTMMHGCSNTCEDITSKNSKSTVLAEVQKLDGAKRKTDAIESFGHGQSDLWYRKELTSRIFKISYDVAQSAKDTFIEKALPSFFLCAPSVGVMYKDTEAPSPQELEQFVGGSMQRLAIPDEMRSLLSTESFMVACSDVLKEMAVECDLTDLEKQMLTKLKTQRDKWKASDPDLPYLDDKIIEGNAMMNYIKECVRITWRMVNLLPPLKMKLVNEVNGRDNLCNFFNTEADAQLDTPTAPLVCVWPAITDYNSDEVLLKGIAAIIPKPKAEKEQEQEQEHASDQERQQEQEQGSDQQRQQEQELQHPQQQKQQVSGVMSP